jgi:hypothetical protein
VRGLSEDRALLLVAKTPMRAAATAVAAVMVTREGFIDSPCVWLAICYA